MVLIWLPILILLFTHSHCISEIYLGYMVTLNIPIEYSTDFIGRAFILETNQVVPSFRVALSAESFEKKHTCSIDVFLGDVKVWSSGHFSRFFTEGKCVLELTRDGDLRLSGQDGRVGWRSGTSGQGVQMSGSLPSRHNFSGPAAFDGNQQHPEPHQEHSSPMDSVGSAPSITLPPVMFVPPAAEEDTNGSASNENEPPCPPPPPVGRTHNPGQQAILFEVKGNTLQPSKVLAKLCRIHCFNQEIQKGAFKWKYLKQRTKNLYWGEFLKYAKWENEDPGLIYKLWERKIRACYRVYISTNVRKPKKAGLPRGLGNDAYAAFKEFWNTKEFMDASAQNKLNRSRGGKARYHGGSKGLYQWSLDLAKEKKPCDPHSVMKHCFTRKHDGKTFTVDRGRKIDERYKSEVAKIQQTQSDPGSSLEVDQTQLYKKVTMEEGGVGHGRVFGTGSASSIFFGDVNEFGPPQLTPSMPPEYADKLSKMEEETKALQLSNQKLEEALRLTNQHLSYMSQFVPPPPPSTTLPMQGFGLGSSSQGNPFGPWMNFSQMLGSQQQQQFPMFSQGTAAGPAYSQPAAAHPIWTQPMSAPMYSQPAPAAPIAPQQQPSSVAPIATPSWVNNMDSAAVEDLAREYAAS